MQINYGVFRSVILIFYTTGENMQRKLKGKNSVAVQVKVLVVNHRKGKLHCYELEATVDIIRQNRMSSMVF